MRHKSSCVDQSIIQTTPFTVSARQQLLAIGWKRANHPFLASGEKCTTVEARVMMCPSKSYVNSSHISMLSTWRMKFLSISIVQDSCPDCCLLDWRNARLARRRLLAKTHHDSAKCQILFPSVIIQLDGDGYLGEVTLKSILMDSECVMPVHLQQMYLNKPSQLEADHGHHVSRRL